MLNPMKTAVYHYDGSFEGYLSCIFEIFVSRTEPLGFITQGEEQLPMYPLKEVRTEAEKAERVYRSFHTKMSPATADFLTNAFLCTEPQREMLMYKVIRKGYKVGGTILSYLTDPDVHALNAGVKALTNEAHLLTEFLRFKDFNGVLVAVISPKNWVLHLMANHFVARFNPEQFMIYDETHGYALVHSPGKWEIVQMDDFALPPITAEEADYQRLWRLFFNTVAIQERRNARCQQSLMPKRYWRNMVEHCPPEIGGAAAAPEIRAGC